MREAKKLTLRVYERKFKVVLCLNGWTDHTALFTIEFADSLNPRINVKIVIGRHLFSLHPPLSCSPLIFHFLAIAKASIAQPSLKEYKLD